MDSVLEHKLPNKISYDGLCPSLPSHTTRYDQSTKVTPTSRMILSPMNEKLKLAPPYLLANWRPFVHPEGQMYFARTTQPVVVTEACISLQKVGDEISAWTALIEARIVDLGIYLTASVEIWMNLGETEGTLQYYFIDHSKHSVFWLDDLHTAAVGLPESVSASHLQHAIEENYWSHVEQFPCHGKGASLSEVDDLINIMFHARADQLTSDSSTFPYTAEECATFLQLLRESRDRISDARITCFVARIWGVIALHRHQIHYGEEVCRLSRTQPILEATPTKSSFFHRALSRALFSIPETYRSQFDDLYVDNILYLSQWEKFVKEVSAEYRTSTQWIFALLLAALLMVPIAPVPIVSVACVAFCAGGLLMGLILSQYTDSLSKFSSVDASDFLKSQRTQHGFAAIATVFSIPKAFLMWSANIFALQCLLFICLFVNPFVAAFGAVVVGSVAYAIRRTLWPPVRHEDVEEPRVNDSPV